MKVEKIKEIEYCRTQFGYTANLEKVEEKIDEAVFALKKAKIPGFRPGKAPDHVIKTKCRKEIERWVQREMLVQAYDDIVFESKIKPIGQPTVDETNFNKNSFDCKMTISMRPEFELADFKNINLVSPHISDDAMEQKEKALHDLRLRMGDVEPYAEGDFVDNGHQVTMDVFATFDGEPFPDATVEGIMYTIGDNKIPGLDNNLLGMLAGEEREFDLKVNDKDLHFKVVLHMGMKRTPHDLNEEFAKKLGMESLEEVEKTLKVMADNRIKDKKDSLLKEQVIKKLLLDNDFEVPSFLVEQEAKFVCANNGLEWDKIDNEVKETFVKKAMDNVKISIIIETIRDAEPLTVMSDNEALTGLRNKLVASGHENSDSYLQQLSKNGSLPGLIGQLKHNFALQWIIDNANIAE